MKSYIGYDLGDGETIVNYIVYDDRDASPTISIKNTVMPSATDEGTPLPTMYAKANNTGKILWASEIINADAQSVGDINISFKRRPSTLLTITSPERYVQLLADFRQKNGEWPSSSSAELTQFRDRVVAFTDGIFGDIGFQQRLKTELLNVDSVTLCIGHPTAWDDLDIAIYERILRASMLGQPTLQIAGDAKPLQLVMESESRAAFLYTRNEYRLGMNPENFTVVIDVGSSTVDVTALSGKAVDKMYNGGHNHLGARLIDVMMEELYVEKLRQTNQMEAYQDILRNNATADKTILYACRRAKEELFSSQAAFTYIFAYDLTPVKITREELNALVDCPLTHAFGRLPNMPEEVVAEIGQNSWREEFRRFLLLQKAELDKIRPQGIHNVILTGSASNMAFVRDICTDIFDVKKTDKVVLPDPHPERSISKGLALVGQSNDKSLAFQEAIDAFVRDEIPGIVEENLPSLVDSLAGIITNSLLDDVAYAELMKWKNMKYKTINEATDAIKNACTEANLTRMLANNKPYNEAIRSWMSETVIRQINQRLLSLCVKYGVSGYTMESIDIGKVPLPGGAINFDGGERVGKELIGSTADFVGIIVAIIGGIIVAVALPTILAVIIVILSYISMTIASIVFGILASLGPVGWAVLAGIAGITVAVLLRNGVQAMKEAITSKIVTYNLPQWVRNRLTEENLRKSLDEQRPKMKAQIIESMLKPDSSQKLVSGISTALSAQTRVKADEIKYIIESK